MKSTVATPSEALRWTLILASVAGLHAAVLLLHVGAAPSLPSESDTLLFAMIDSETLPDVSPEFGRMEAAETPVLAPREELASAPAAGPLSSIPAPRTRNLHEQRALTLEEVATVIDRPAQTARPDPGAGLYGDDPLAPPPLSAFAAPSGPAGAAGGGSATEGGAATAGFASAAGGGNGGGGSTLDRIAHAMGPVKRAAFSLPGKPDYPQACRKGICRGGRPCMGISQWRITVDADGGKPERVEAIMANECELLNAAIKKFFMDSKFPKTGQTNTYVFPVQMFVD